MSTPTISIILPIHNAEAHLRETLECLIAQTFTDWEAICAENGSTDGTAAILQEFAQKDARFRILSLPPIGAGAARNAGMEAARGRYICFCDADDLYTPHALRNLLTRAQETEADVVLGNVEFFYPDNRRTATRHPLCTRHPQLPTAFCPIEHYPNELFEIANPWCWGKLYRTEHLRQHNIRFSEHRRAEDVPFIYIALALAKRISFLPECCYLYRQTPDSLSHCMTQEPHIFLEAFLTTWRRAEAEQLPECALNSLRRFFLSNCLYQPTLMRQEDAWECLRLIRDKYEPIFRLLSLPPENEIHALMLWKYKALITPECSIVLDLSHGWGHLEDCVESIRTESPLAAEILVLTTEVPVELQEKLRAYAEGHYYLRLITDLNEADTQHLYKLDTRRGVRAGTSTEQLFGSPLNTTPKAAELEAGTFRILRCCGLQRLPRVTRWQLGRKSLWSLQTTPQGRHCFLFGKRLS